MNAIYVSLLRDPSLDYFSQTDTQSDLLGSFDSEHHRLKDLSNYESLLSKCHSTVATMEELHRSGKVFLDNQFCTLIGLESKEVTTMIKDVVTWVFRKIYNFIAGTINFVRSIIKKIVSVDSRLNDYSNMKYKELENHVRKAPMEVTEEAEKIMQTKMLDQMCPKDTFTRMLENFHLIADPTKSFISTDINKLITNIGVVHSPKLLSKDVINTPAMKVQLDSLGIKVDELKVAYTSPFSDYPKIALKDLHFTKMSDILDLNKLYSEKVWSKTGMWNDLVNQLETFQKTLKQKEKDLLSSSSVDKTVLTENASLLQKEISFVLHIVGALRQFKTSLNFRRKELCIAGVSAYEEVIKRNAKGK